MATKTNTEINGYKYYRITRTVDHVYKDSKKVPVKKQFCGRSKGDAERKYREYLEEQARIKAEGEAAVEEATMDQRIKEYIEIVLEHDNIAPSTRKCYANAYDKYISGTWLAQMRVQDIKPVTIQKFYNELDVSARRFAHITALFKRVFAWIELNEYGSNVVASVPIPQKKSTKKNEDIVVWSDEELDAIKRQIIGHRDELLVYTLIYTGMRISEALGLKYEDIDGDVIHIRRQRYKGTIQTPKANSVRDIPLHPNLKDRIPDNRTGFIFGATYSNISVRLHKLYKTIGVQDKPIHTYRHTFATNLCRAGVPLEVTSKLLGHKSLEVTAQFYAKITEDSKRGAILKIT